MNAQQGSSKLASDLVTSLIGLVGTRTFGLIGGVLLARLLPPAERGEFGLAALAALAVGTAATLGAEYWITPRTATGHAQARVASLTGQRIRMGGAALAVILLVLALIGATRDRFPIAIAATAWAFSNLCSMLLLAQLGGQRRLRKVAIAQVSTSAAFAAGIGILLVLDRPDVWLALAVAAAGAALLAVLASDRDSISILSADAADLVDARRIGLPAMAGEIAGLFANRISWVLIGAVLSTREIGLFVVAASIADMLLILPNAISQVLLPQVAADGHGRSTGPLVALTLTAGGLGAVVIAIAGEILLVPVFGDLYEEATEPLLLLAAAAVAVGTWRLLLADLAGRGNTAIRLSSSIIAGAVVIVADLALLDRYGLLGAGWAALAGGLTGLAITMVTWQQDPARRLRDLTQLRQGITLVRGAVARRRADTPTA